MNCSRTFPNSCFAVNGQDAQIPRFLLNDLVPTGRNGNYIGCIQREGGPGLTKEVANLIRVVETDALSNTLPKVIRLAQGAGNKGLETWARLELHGYFNDNAAMDEDAMVPGYRSVAGFWFDDYGRKLVLDEENITFVNEIRLRYGAVQLEGLLGATGPLAMRMPEWASLINDALRVNVTTFKFDPRAIPSVLAAIKTELSDRLMTLEPSVGTSSAVSEVPKEILQIKPGIYGINVDVKEIWRRWRARNSMGGDR
jgi:hypothetical protein